MNKIKNEEIIVINNIEQLKQILKDNSYNNFVLMVVDNKIMIKGVKCSKPEPKAPEWFSSWVKNQYEKTPPSWFSSWVKNQYEKDIKHINNRLDNVDKRLDKHDQLFEKIIKFNNLKTK